MGPRFSHHNSDAGRASGLFYASPYFYILDIHQFSDEKNCRSGWKQHESVLPRLRGGLTVCLASAAKSFCVQMHAIGLKLGANAPAKVITMNMSGGNCKEIFELFTNTVVFSVSVSQR